MKGTILCLTLALSSTCALAVGTSNWKHTSEADFKAGTFDNAVATNLGDVKLSRAVRALLGQDARISAVYCMVQAADGTIYAGTGPEGVVLSIKNEKIETVATLAPNTNVFSLLINDQGQLLIGTGGEKGRILRIAKPGEEPKEIFAADEVQYLWSMVQTPDGSLYAATGPQGRLFHIKPDGKHEILFDSDENNLLSLISDGKDLLYAGTDPNGLIFRINRKTRDIFVLYDAGESEISALALDAAGNLYAGTAQATPQPPGDAAAQARTEQVGRPEGETGGVPIPSKPPQDPQPPELPDPNPGEPPPIPSDAPDMPSPETTEPVSLAIFTADDASATKNDSAEADAKEDPAQPLQVPPRPRRTVPAAAPPPRPAAAGSAQPGAQGNAIYRIDPAGFVTEIFRQPVLVYTLLERDGTLLVGTGSEGLVYQINPAAEETVVLAKVEPKEVLCLLPTRDGSIYMGLANSGDVAVMTSGYAKKGTFTSPVLDASQISRFGKIRLSGTLPKGTTLTVATRSGNVKDTTNAGWSSWSDEMPASRFLQTPSPAARFLQYRLTFTSSDGQISPIVDEVNVAYQVPNQPPQIKSIQIAPAAPSGGPARAPAASTEAGNRRMQTITWEAADPNNDALQYRIFFRLAGSEPWIVLKDRLSENTFEWDTLTIADGRYEVRVVASDAAANEPGTGRTASRVSDPVVVDNTAPVIGNLTAVSKGNAAEIAVTVVDRATTVASLEYSINSQDDWQTVLPDDKIADSPEETYRFSVGDLAAGPHQIALRARDAHGNPAHESVVISIDRATAQKD